MNGFINELVWKILFFVAQNEWKFIPSHQKEGIEAARLKGKHLGSLYHVSTIFAIFFIFICVIFIYYSKNKKDIVPMKRCLF